MKPLIKRELKVSGYRWEMQGKKLILIYTKTNTEIPLTKIAAMSLVKFIPNYLDKMRIEDIRILKAKMSAYKQAEKEKKLKRQESLFGKKIDKVINKAQQNAEKYIKANEGKGFN
jgi:hypothetical protein